MSFGVSEEDTSSDEYARMAPEIRAKLVFLEGCPRYGQAIKALHPMALGEILFCGSDDILFRTQGWDSHVREAFASVPDQLLVAYADNGMGRQKCEHFFTTRRWVEVVGYLNWPEFRHFYVDQWVEDLASRTGRLRHLRQVVVERLHLKYGKTADDETYRLVRGNTGTAQSDMSLYAQRGPQRDAAVARLLAAMSHPPRP